MFTGIVQGIARVSALTRKQGLVQLQIELPNEHCDQLELGASIALNGTCLTITEHAAPFVSFDVIDTTLELTNLGSLEVGSSVNFERAARIGDEIGGHLMSGHILCCAEVMAVEYPDANNCHIRFKTPEVAARYLLPKGFAGLNGCSLTLADADAQSFSVSLIPETLSRTTFSDLQPGDRVNLEVDPQTQAIVDTVERYMQQRG
ncbi:riboflavin synthase subunit alpha [Marinobacterium sp. AK62]|uniref:Riboflavin synthase n=1 Tax=Marinobacterium alkalitolerans TaxID=1542925 RepID=A0ABS3ZCU8_9GAMM|nr:riboflavin synthase subunit alpha [Marinobacterium alkalitolerans]MBP0049520.1 riboflavin synthase subunit alpha [Marinobacterium alkalitolerans]